MGGGDSAFVWDGGVAFPRIPGSVFWTV